MDWSILKDIIKPFIVCTPVSFQPNFKKRGGLTGSQFLQGVAGKKWGDFFQGGGCSFYIKNELKSEIFNDKKSL